MIERILRDRQSIWQQIVDERELGQLTTHMLASSAIALALYGAVLGAFHSALMALTSAVKLPLLFLITAPNYGFFKLLNVAILTLSALVGLRFLTGGMQVLNEHGLLAPAAVPAAAPAVPAAPAAPATPVAAAEAVPVTPISAVPATAVPAAAPAAVNGGASSTVVSAPLPPPGWDPRARSVYPPAPLRPQRPPVREAQRPASMTLLYIWILLFGFVGTQLAWTLRPFFGSPGQEFALFRSIEGNFYAEILRTIANLF
ncbi:hypothetical protein [Phytohabitans suffuscus]|uniref:hypothetical protein n=1 Tax=Phytohabitans suffuscus TaxID=624315 RepID=UPI001E384F03|nr:hypothetical protein [Phytohabitans suffuscus]